MLELYASGKSQADVGVQIGCSKNAIWKRRDRLNCGGVMYANGTTFVEHKMVSDTFLKYQDLLLGINRCNNAGIGVRIDIALLQASFLAWRDPDGEISFFDPATMRAILNQTNP